MSRLKDFLEKNKKAAGSRTAKAGGYSFLISALVLAALIGVNILVSSLPTTWTRFDISSARLYSLTAESKAVLTNLEEDVDIYWIVQSGQENAVLERLLDVYDSMSDHISVEVKNPDVYPTFAQQYTDGTIYNNSLVVVSGERYRYIDYNDIFEADTSDYYYTGTIAYDFDGEGEITTAVNYVTKEELPKVYLLTGHSEVTGSSVMEEALRKANYETEELSLLNIDEVPEDCEALIINAPSSDISDEEAKMLLSYVEEGGKVMILSGLQMDTELPNLHSVAEAYGLEFAEGIVVEEDRDYYAFSSPYILLPALGTTNDITGTLAENDAYVIASIAVGMSLTNDTGKGEVTSLLTTSSAAFSKAAGYAIETYEKEEGDTEGPFSVGVLIEDNENGGAIIYITSDYLMDETYESYSAGANTDLFMNSLSYLAGAEESITIRTRSLDYDYLTISESNAQFIKIILIAVLPLLFLIFGIDTKIRRRKMA